MYAAGAPHARREGCQAVLREVVAGHVDAVTSAEVVREILHRFSAGRRDVGVRMATATLDLLGPVVEVDHRIMVDAVSRFAQDARLSSRDVVHVATCAALGIDTIISVDMGFDRAAGLRRLDPDTFLI